MQSADDIELYNDIDNPELTQGYDYCVTNDIDKDIQNLLMMYDKDMINIDYAKELIKSCISLTPGDTDTIIPVFELVTPETIHEVIAKLFDVYLSKYPNDKRVKRLSNAIATM